VYNHTLFLDAVRARRRIGARARPAYQRCWC